MAKTKEIKVRGVLSAQHFINNFVNASLNKNKDRIRIQTSSLQRGFNLSFSWDTFELNKDNIIIKCPRGYTERYKGFKVDNLDLFPPTMLFGNEI